MHWSCAVRKQVKIRIITNRTRERDGGATAGESLIAWLRTTKEVPEWKKIRCLLFCGDTSTVKHVVAPDLTYVSSNAHVLANFCEPKPDWNKIV